LAIWIVQPLVERDIKVPTIAMTNNTRIPSQLTRMVIAGWGSTAERTIVVTNDRLHEAIVPMVSRKKCKRAYGYDVIQSNHICAGYDNGGIDTCQGDSGGPLMYFNKKANQYLLLGVTAWGYGCGQPGYFGVYTRVATYIDWIVETATSNKPARPSIKVSPWNLGQLQRITHSDDSDDEAKQFF
jgi:secreted trypsin-like serine protease